MEIIDIKGYISKIIYFNKNNYFGIFVLDNEGENITCKGTILEVQVGEYIAVTGQFVEDPKYGKQFKVETFKIETPTDEKNVYRYLASGAIKGIKEGLAKKICDVFGEDSLRIIDEEPERLAEIKGISLRKAQEIAMNSQKNKGMRDILIFLQSFDIGNAIGMKIYEKYKDNTYNIVQNNPYSLIQTIEGISFNKAEVIAQKVGILVDSEYRITSAVLYLMKEAINGGDSFVYQTILIEKAKQLLRVSQDKVLLGINNLCVDRELIESTIENQTVYYTGQSYRMEMECARMIYDLADPLENIWENVTVEKSKLLFEYIKELADKNKIILESLQEKAIYKSIINPITVITGGPGTGKTTIIKMIIQYFRNLEKDVFLAAPTGRAAKRMTEATGYEAKTIHRLLEASGNIEEGHRKIIFGRNEHYTLEADVIIIDEVSMVDIYLFQALLRAVSIGTQLILVGDTEQLPSVGPGQVLKDIIKSGICEVIELQKIYRQAEESGIIKNAHRVKEGKLLEILDEDYDILFYEESNIDKIREFIHTYILNQLKDTPAQEIQVLTPMKAGDMGVVELNKYIQKHINPAADDKREYEKNGILFREGDKVIQLKNNYQMQWQRYAGKGIKIEEGLGIFNGDIGTVIKINLYDQSLIVEFDEGQQVTYTKEQLEELDLAYAITIHKSQGSEYPIVIIPLCNVPMIMCYRNLLYTGITRAKKRLLLVGSRQIIKSMVENVQIKNRNTSLGEMIEQFIE